MTNLQSVSARGHDQRTRLTGRALCCLALVVVAGCGSDENTEPKPPEEEKAALSGLPVDTVASELTAAEAQALCQAYAAHVEANVSETTRDEGGCVLAAITSQDVAGCEASVEQCLQNGGGVAITPPAATCTSDENKLASCTATVGEIEDCFLESAELSKVFYDNLSCQTLIEARQGGGAGFPIPEVSEACTTLQAKCSAITAG